MQFITTWIWAAGPVWLNLQALAMKGDIVWMPVAAMIGVAAAAGCYMFAMVRHPLWKAVALLCTVVAACYNVPTAIGSSAEHRQASSAQNQERIQRRESMLRRDAVLADKIAKIGWRLNGDTSFSIQAGIEQLKTTPHFIATDGCRNLRAKDPEQICFKLSGEGGRLNEARQVEAHEAERESIRKELLMVEGPETADAGVATLASIISPLYKIDEKMIVAILNSIGPVALEVLGTLMPALVGRYWFEKNRIATRPHSASDRKPLSVFAESPTESPYRKADSGHFAIQKALSADLYIMEKFERFSDASLNARQTYSEWAKCAKQNGLSAGTEAEFAVAMERAGYTKELVDRRKSYVNVRLKSMKLEVVR